MNRIIFITHGIRGRKSDTWMNDFISVAKADPRFKDDVFISFYYGYVTILQAILPIIKFMMVKKVRTAIRKAVTDYPNRTLNIIAYSYGTELSYWAIKTSGEDGMPPIYADKLILVASIVSRYNHIPYNDTLRAGKILAIHVYCSLKDWVTNFNPFGHSGTWGFSKSRYDNKYYSKPIDDLEIYNHQLKTLSHGDYFLDIYYKQWLDIIDNKIKNF